ncbi:MAG: MFS transporter [Rhodospirillaceae bacterium]
MIPKAIDPRAALAWCSYDWGITAGHAVIDTFIFSVYFSRSVAASPAEGTAAWGNALAAAGFVIAVLSPVLGAIADRTGRRKPWIAGFTVIAVAAMLALYGVTPEPASAPLALTGLAVMVAARELALVFYNAMLPTLAPPDHLGRLSGWGWAAGYVGGLACLVLALWGLVKADAPLFGLLGTAAQENVRATAPLAGLWLALFALPLFIWTPDQPATGIGLGQAAREGLATLWQTLREARKYRDIAWFLVASAFYRDGLATLTAFGGLYAAGSFGMSFSEILVFAMLLNVTAALGAASFAWIDDRIGARPTIIITLVGLLAFAGGILLVHDKVWFWGLSMGLGTFIGPSQAAGRSLLARLAPAGMVTEMFGLYGLSGKAAAFLGPLALGWATAAFDSQRAGMATILVFFLAGLVLMLGVREPRS